MGAARSRGRGRVGGWPTARRRGGCAMARRWRRSRSRRRGASRASTACRYPGNASPHPFWESITAKPSARASPLAKSYSMRSLWRRRAAPTHHRPPPVTLHYSGTTSWNVRRRRSGRAATGRVALVMRSFRRRRCRYAFRRRGTQQRNRRGAGTAAADKSSTRQRDGAAARSRPPIRAWPRSTASRSSVRSRLAGSTPTRRSR